MFHKIKAVRIMPDCHICVSFSEGITKIYDVKPLFEKWDAFSALKDEKLFAMVAVDVGGCGVIWNDNIDLSSEELYYNGKTVPNPFDGIMAFSDATQLWDLNESTLRKAVSYGKFIEGIDVCKYGKQWVVTREAMEREYGSP